MAVRGYLRFGPSDRDVEELLAERGVVVDHVTVYRWVQTFTAEFIDAARPLRHIPGDRSFVDETYVKIAGRWTYLCEQSIRMGRSSTYWCRSAAIVRSAATIAAGPAFIQNLRGGHYDIATEHHRSDRLLAAITELVACL